MNKQSYLYAACGVAAIIAAWQIASWLVGRSWLLPAPAEVAWAIGENLALLLRHSRHTLTEALAGMAAATLLALALALLMSLSARLRQAVYPLLLGSQMVPIVVLAPLFLIWFGYGILPKVLVVILVCFFPMVINAWAGLSAVDGETLAFYRLMGMSEGQLFRIVRLPAALPYLFGGLRVAAAYSVMGAVIGEWLGAEAGLGLLLTRAQRSYDLPLAFAAILAIILWSAMIFGAVAAAERFCLKWRRATGEKWE